MNVIDLRTPSLVVFFMFYFVGCLKNISDQRFLHGNTSSTNIRFDKRCIIYSFIQHPYIMSSLFSYDHYNHIYIFHENVKGHKSRKTCILRPCFFSGISICNLICPEIPKHNVTGCPLEFLNPCFFTNISRSQPHESSLLTFENSEIPLFFIFW